MELRQLRLLVTAVDPARDHVPLTRPGITFRLTRPAPFR
jgi:hypothetical protein